VTVLFADFAGFTELADQMDPEELQVLVSGIFEDLAEEAIRHDGTIEKFIGDAIFVVFGAPVAHEDDPQRALRTALAMQRVFADHAARVKKARGVEFGLRIGIHTGMVVAGAVRSVAEDGVMGDTVNVASRLQSLLERIILRRGEGGHRTHTDEPEHHTHAVHRAPPKDSSKYSSTVIDWKRVTGATLV